MKTLLNITYSLFCLLEAPQAYNLYPSTYETLSGNLLSVSQKMFGFQEPL